MSVRVRMTGGSFPGIEALKRRIASGNYHVRVGVPENAGNAKDHDGKDSGVSLATIAAANNYGTDEGHIPARSFMETGLTRGEKKFVRLNRINLHRILLGQVTIQQALEQLGALGAGEVKMAIHDSKSLFKENAPSTIARKGSDQPLKDSGTLEQSITWEVPGRA